ncbi:DUF485 domain-containing protein [Oceanobacillus senegalensis]|uniref:DUF485 domain-containing protein n=1 Tax=Oceanobacillus senegalensis TaxID=1936063 RepID=UPI0015C4C5AA|nr:DUF485 domain-containing protein [Oceanobacillus senegalensis]
MDPSKLYNNEELRQLIRRRIRLNFYTSFLFIFYYLFAPLFFIKFPDFLGEYLLLLSWLYVFSLFIGTWLVGWWYSKRAKVYEYQKNEIINKGKGSR